MNLTPPNGDIMGTMGTRITPGAVGQGASNGQMGHQNRLIETGHKQDKPAINPPLRLPHGTANRLIKGSNGSWKSGINHKDRKDHKDFSPFIFSAFFAFSAVKYF